ncbi:hypothetical protein ACQR1W_02320 [Bradyrhizobium sp. HKCCYLS1011]|uniref:hypothetical protein n=1 Tax=Bradyrhizobium sp. HKCCYLS1011 TaxID=3420733 RepID=UPI003EBB4B7E
MSEVESFGNIVNSLVALRQNYHEQLKSLPQYEAYLQVESSTERAAHALQNGAALSPIAAEVIDSLQFARNRYEQHLNSVPEYRALLAIDRLIKEISLELGVQSKDQESIAEQPEAPAEAAVAPAGSAPAEPEIVPAEADEPIHVEIDELADSEVRAIAIEDEDDAPTQAAPVAPIDIDAELVEDDIVAVQLASAHHEEADADEDLRDIAYRDLAEATSATASPAARTEPYSTIPEQLKSFDETDEAAA